ncbi:MAG: hypothetical protein GTO41_17345 [Burkholderiales bacterium]|nr:hypothetical protein [Burkholderiales bacterium]
MKAATPDVLKNVDTEPEAAHLRNVLRRIVVLLDQGPGPADVKSIAEICLAALARPRTNGAVIDKLTKENGDLQSEVIELRARIAQWRAQHLAMPPSSEISES